MAHETHELHETRSIRVFSPGAPGTSPPAELDALRAKGKQDYTEQTDSRYGAARGWVDAIIQPHDTRATLLRAFALACRPTPKASFHTGVLPV